MPDEQALVQVQMIANVISSMPPQQPGGPRIPIGKPKVAQWASELYSDFGVRVHPELAKKTVVEDGPDILGGAGSKRIVDVVDLGGLKDLLRGFSHVPSLAQLADDIDAAAGDPLKEQALRDKIAQEQPDVIRTAKLILERAKPQDFEPKVSEQ